MDFVFDRYLKNSIKTQNSEDRKKEMRISVRRDTLFCEDFKQITRFQADLFLMISNSISQIRNVPTSAVKECNTYDVHENCSIFMTPHSLVHLRPKFFHPLDLEHPISNIFPLPHFQMIINQLKENMIEGWLLYVNRLAFRLVFIFSINSIIFSGFPLTFFHLAEASLFAVVQKYHEMSFICNHSHF